MCGAAVKKISLLETLCRSSGQSFPKFISAKKTTLLFPRRSRAVAPARLPDSQISLSDCGSFTHGVRDSNYLFGISFFFLLNFGGSFGYSGFRSEQKERNIIVVPSLFIDMEQMQRQAWQGQQPIAAQRQQTEWEDG